MSVSLVSGVLTSTAEGKPQHPGSIPQWGAVREVSNMGVTHGKKAEHSHQHQHSGCAQPLIGPDSISDLCSVTGCDQRWDREKDLDQKLVEHTDEGYYEELIRPKKLLNPGKASRNHRELHRKVLITHKRGVSAEEEPELQKVLDQRNKALRYMQEEEGMKHRSPLIAGAAVETTET